MYESYWKLDERPFENTSDARFYYPSEAHQGALLKLRYAMENRHGAAVLAGATGVGKTLLAQSLLERLPEDFTPRVHLVFPQMPPDQLLACLADHLSHRRSASAPATVHRSVRRIEDVLKEGARQSRHAVVVVDEAHLLSGAGLLETLRLLLNLPAGRPPGLSLLLVGRPSLLPALERMPALEERVGMKCLLRPFTIEETISYVSHRLSAAGASRTIFDQEAMEAIHHLTQGVPRRINRLADLALLLGYAEERTTIDAAQIEAVSDELVRVAPE